jgi:hypothetical protein
MAGKNFKTRRYQGLMNDFKIGDKVQAKVMRTSRSSVSGGTITGWSKWRDIQCAVVRKDDGRVGQYHLSNLVHVAEGENKNGTQKIKLKTEDSEKQISINEKKKEIYKDVKKETNEDQKKKEEQKKNHDLEEHLKDVEQRKGIHKKRIQRVFDWLDDLIATGVGDFIPHSWCEHYEMKCELCPIGNFEICEFDIFKLQHLLEKACEYQIETVVKVAASEYKKFLKTRTDIFLKKLNSSENFYLLFSEKKKKGRKSAKENW